MRAGDPLRVCRPRASSCGCAALVRKSRSRSWLPTSKRLPMTVTAARTRLIATARSSRRPIRLAQSQCPVRVRPPDELGAVAGGPSRCPGLLSGPHTVPVGFRVLAGGLLLPELVLLGHLRFDRPMDLVVVDVTPFGPKTCSAYEKQRWRQPSSRPESGRGGRCPRLRVRRTMRTSMPHGDNNRARGGANQ